jgi:hypothetical protein
MGDAVAGPLERGGADDRGRLRIDQLLIELLGRRADAVGDIGEFEFSQQVEQAGWSRAIVWCPLCVL